MIVAKRQSDFEGQETMLQLKATEMGIFID
jgi:hypothetical protein